jgi:hypothetical protein
MNSKNLKAGDYGYHSPANDEMVKYGITCVPVEYFHYKDFRYTTLKDALAQAKRDELAN